MTFRRITAAVGATALLGVAASTANAAEIYSTQFQALNGSGIDGRATLTVNDDRSALTVRINATGLEPGGVHLGHIHGMFSLDGTPMDSITPPPSADVDGDGFVELAEGVPSYGPILIDFGNVDPDGDGIVDYSQTFNLLDPTVFGTIGMTTDRYDVRDLLGQDLVSLDLREIVLHGLTVPAVGAGTPGEVDGIPGYKVLLPAASGEIVSGAVPEPTTWAMMIGGFGGIGFALRRRARRLRLSF